MKIDPAQVTFSQLLISGTLVHETNFHDLQQKLDLQVRPNLAMVLSIDRYPILAKDQPLEWRKTLGHTVVDIAEDTLCLPFTCVWVEEGVLALLIEMHLAEANQSKFDNEAIRVARSIQSALALNGTAVSIGIGSFTENPYELYTSFREARESMNGRFFQGNQLIFKYNRQNTTVESWNDPLASDKTEFLALVQMGNVKSIRVHLQTLLKDMAKACHYNENMFRSQTIDLVIMMSRTAVDSGVNATLVLSRNAHFIHELYTTIRYDNFEKKVLDYGEWLSAEVEGERIPKASLVIRQVIGYIKEHHRDNLSLDSVAHVSCLSKYYLSHLFKKEIGLGVMVYLNKIRIEKAIFYVATTDLSIQEIAGQVGFEDANYFSRIFKKYTGSSPSAYRITKLG